ncbi:MAG: peptidoglycan-binding protein [Oscillospiraceae bacterium]|nr:peptidoglycan-binding protein [Oscillospiraceae bacterium]
MKGIKRIISVFLCFVITAAIFAAMPISASAATEPDHSYWNYTAPTVVLKKGNSMSKSNVKWLQSALNDLAYRGDINNKKLNLRAEIGDDYLVVDGSFGTKTDKAVRAFQKQYSLTVDGAFGTNSRNKMKAVYKPKPTTPTCPHYGPWETIKEPTCGTTGIEYRQCRKCGYEQTRTIAATGNHDCRSGWIIGKERGCFTTGERHKVCAICHKNVNSETLPAYGCHNWGKWSVVQEATCTKTGRRRQYCSRCGGYQEENIPAGHTWVYGDSSAFPQKKCAKCPTVEYDLEQKYREELKDYFTDAELDKIVNDVDAFYSTTQEIRDQSTNLGRWFELCSVCTGCRELRKIADSCSDLNETCDYFDLAWTARTLVIKKANYQKYDQSDLDAVIDSLCTLCSRVPGATYFETALESIKASAAKMMEAVNKNQLNAEMKNLEDWLANHPDGKLLDPMTYEQINIGTNAYNKVIKYYNKNATSAARRLFSDADDYWFFFKELKREQSKHSTVQLSDFLGEQYGV